MPDLPATEPEPVTNQELPAIADRVARGLITYLLTEGRNFLGDAIGEAIGDDPDAARFDPYIHSKVYSLVWDQLGRAATEYKPRDQVLAEAADIANAEGNRLGEIAEYHVARGARCAAARIRRAARTGLEG